MHGKQHAFLLFPSFAERYDHRTCFRMFGRPSAALRSFGGERLCMVEWWDYELHHAFIHFRLLRYSDGSQRMHGSRREIIYRSHFAIHFRNRSCRKVHWR